MTARILPMRIARHDHLGTIHVTGHQLGGFEIGHESASGNSWGSFSGPYRTGQEAITAAYALNIDTYGGVCDVFVCDAAMQDAAHVELPSNPGDL